MTNVGTFLRIWCAVISMGAILTRSEPSKNSGQEMLSIPVRVVDPDGKPVARAVVVPWALRCSQGHGSWDPKGFGHSKPPTFSTDEQGNVEVQYPRYAIADERVLTTEVTLSIDHPRFAYVAYEFINVPRQENGPHTVTLKHGASLEITPVQDGKPASPKGLHAIWSDHRSWKPGVEVTLTADGLLSIPPMPVGKGQVLLARLDGDRVTHFSRIVNVDLKPDETPQARIELQPARRILGSISDMVPRPVKSGRIKCQTLPKDTSDARVTWFTWVPIAADGTFVINAWPEGEPIQIIALCDGYMAESGPVPDVVERKPVGPDSFHRPQVFSPEEQTKPIVLRMKPTVRCDIEAVDTKGSPVVGAHIGACPNVGWWNGGSQVYCAPLVRGERLLVKRDFRTSIDDTLPSPFTTTTDSKGRGHFDLPAGNEGLYAEHDDYELPVERGRRDHRIKVVAGETNAVRLVFQRKGSEHLGEWDKLAGVLFGCTGEQCRRLLNDPAFRVKMAKVRDVLDAADDPNNPTVLFVAYMSTADAFDRLGDKEEAVNWRHKAIVQFQRLSSGSKEHETAPKK